MSPFETPWENFNISFHFKWPKFYFYNNCKYKSYLGPKTQIHQLSRFPSGGRYG